MLSGLTPEGRGISPRAQLGINVVGDWLRDTLDPTLGEAG